MGQGGARRIVLFLLGHLHSQENQEHPGAAPCSPGGFAVSLIPLEGSLFALMDRKTPQYPHANPVSLQLLKQSQQKLSPYWFICSENRDLPADTSFEVPHWSLRFAQLKLRVSVSQKKKKNSFRYRENESKVVLGRISVMGAGGSQYQDVVSELHTPRSLLSVAAPLVYEDGAALPRWHLTATSPENDISEPD